jgi:hypothetical protein
MNSQAIQEAYDSGFWSKWAALLNGKAKKHHVTSSDVDGRELRTGIAVEKEHTDNKQVARTIALDHLAENDPKYYTHLKAMEAKYQE